MPTSKDMLMRVLDYPPHYKAVHELGIMGYSENNLATRLSELAVAGKVVSRYRHGKRYKEWAKTAVVGQQLEMVI